MNARISSFLHCVTLILSIVSLTACGIGNTSAPTTTPIPPTQEEMIPTATPTTPTISPTQAEVIPTVSPMESLAETHNESVDVKAICTLIGQDKITKIQLDTPVNIVWGWNAKTKAQINDFLENNITTITLDGKVIEGYQFGGIIKVESRNDYEVVWISNVGILEPGQHTITYDLRILKKIEDGYNSYGPGTEHETEHDECLIVVQ